jgi:hypothetical protein
MLSMEIPGRRGDDTSRAILDLLTPGRRDKQSYLDLMSGDGRWPREVLGLSAAITFIDIVGERLPRHLERSCQVGARRCFELDALAEHPVLVASHYDVALCLDGIEHITKKKGRRLLNRMVALAPRCILFTPYRLGAELDGPESMNPDSHKCEWEPGDVPGWASIVLPDFHKPTWSGGAFWFWTCPDLEADFGRVAEYLSSWGWLSSVSEALEDE